MSGFIIQAENSADIRLIEQMAKRMGLKCFHYNTDNQTLPQEGNMVSEYAGLWEDTDLSAEQLIEMIENSRTSSSLKQF